MYLAMERVAETKHELRDGELWAMAGGSPRHNRIASRCIAELDTALRGQPCAPFGSDQRIAVPARGNYCYPDVSVICGVPTYHGADPDTIVNPKVIFEVLSRTTQRDDLGPKFEDYRSVESLEEYVLVRQDRVSVEVRRRDGPTRWTIEELSAGQSLELKSIDVTIPVDVLYEGAFELRGDDDAR